MPGTHFGIPCDLHDSGGNFQMQRVWYTASHPSGASLLAQGVIAWVSLIIYTLEEERASIYCDQN